VTLTHEELDAAQDMYYKMAGWDKTSGNPTPETMKRLELDWVA
jgi:aldehyde:ferredoxin oxidoreductase